MIEELTGTIPGENTGKNALTQRNLIKTDKPSEKKRKTCATIKCGNSTTDMCNSCRGMVFIHSFIQFLFSIIIKQFNTKIIYCILKRSRKGNVENAL